MTLLLRRGEACVRTRTRIFLRPGPWYFRLRKNFSYDRHSPSRGINRDTVAPILLHIRTSAHPHIRTSAHLHNCTSAPLFAIENIFNIALWTKRRCRVYQRARVAWEDSIVLSKHKNNEILLAPLRGFLVYRVVYQLARLPHSGCGGSRFESGLPYC